MSEYLPTILLSFVGACSSWSLFFLRHGLLFSKPSLEKTWGSHHQTDHSREITQILDDWESPPEVKRVPQKPMWHWATRESGSVQLPKRICERKKVGSFLWWVISNKNLRIQDSGISSTTLYYKVLLQYCSALQSTTPVLLCTTKYYSTSTTPCYKVLLQYYSVLQSATPVLYQRVFGGFTSRRCLLLPLGFLIAPFFGMDLPRKSPQRWSSVFTLTWEDEHISIYEMIKG